MSDSLGQMNHNLEGLKSDLNEVTKGRDCLDSEVLVLKEQLEMAQAVAEENEAIAIEARQMAEARKNYAEEEEVKLLEKSVEELEYTINVLENKGELVKGEAERQRLQREELEGDPTETVHVEGYVAVHVHLYLVLKTLNRPLIVLLILC
ncbi:kinesin-like protein KIN-12D isoform X1 [Magnolia sinica]|uniref:kinesin-like protein KIN-12D isoform X1 n=1 Tax=Magnolia sinica TaxID=86752 RepID=UPI00265961F9|nr:kinesin-like protein KIN-12D isoform X1 [Magnolia sinica]